MPSCALSLALVFAATATTGPGESPEDPDPSQHFNFWNFHYRGKDEYGGPYGDGYEITKQGQKVQEEPMSPPFILLIVNFVVVLLILYKYLWPVASRVARERHDQIEAMLAESAAIRDRAAARLAASDEKLARLDAEVRALIEDILAVAAEDRSRILARAEASAAQIRRDAERRIAAELERARRALMDEIARAAIAATERLLRAAVTDSDEEHLVASFVEGISDGASGAGR